MNDNFNKIKLICKSYNIVPSRSKGQNFLVNQEIIDKIVDSAGLKPSDAVLEVGPGLGILTEKLLEKAKNVISVELDSKLFAFLKFKFSGVTSLNLINSDILDFNPESFKLSAKGGSASGGKVKSYKLVANIPYNITSVFLKKFLTISDKPESMTLLVQKEVAKRICAKPGEMSLLSVSVQLYGEPKIVEPVGRNNFWPSPEVDSAILKINSIKSKEEVDNYLGAVSEKRFWQFLKICFSSKRKQIHNNLSSGLKISSDEIKKLLKKAKFDPKIRAQDLSMDDWLSLTRELSAYLDKSL